MFPLSTPPPPFTLAFWDGCSPPAATAGDGGVGVKVLHGGRGELNYWTPIKPPTPEVETICQQVKPDIEQQAHKRYTTVTPLAFKVQYLPDFTNYKILIQADSDYLTISVYEPPAPGKPGVSEFAFQPQ
ncbi:hypothetical protein JZ751_009286 [Albula glossodonta]|uniref:Uncharacterized protein n=1 Tax=Albula glossodonta TaxID=121402 RepID=A0A8T2N3G6_9TELE|nr:hypothetical protein JZ751_009286 [Albula glossodonta]